MSRFVLPALIVAACTAYALVRYTVFGGVSTEQIPVYVLNKGVSFGGLIILGWSRIPADPRRRRGLGMTGLALMVIHVVLSLSILTPAYFGKFYRPSGLMTWQAEASTLAGVLAFLSLCCLFVASQNQNESHGEVAHRSLWPLVGRAMLVLAAAHVALMGYAGWLKPGSWPGFLPPITLLSFLAAVVAALLRRRTAS